MRKKSIVSIIIFLVVFHQTKVSLAYYSQDDDSCAIKEFKAVVPAQGVVMIKLERKRL